MKSSESDRPLALDRRRTDRRAHTERRVAVLPFPGERRGARDRRLGVDRRVADLDPRDQLHTALELLFEVVERSGLDDIALQQLDGAILRVRVALDRLETRVP
ncbi:MAG: hypothetical protein OER21_01205 [Gemmatimonadota bacterium]|nr:hypothetical protein [Gemmatimonadota bacterium]